MFAELAKPKERDHSYPSKVEDVVNQLAQRAHECPPWIDRIEVRESYEHAYVTARYRGRGVKLAEVSDSVDVARHIIQLVVKMLIAAKGTIAKNRGRGA